MRISSCVAATLGPLDRAIDRARAALGDASRTIKFLRGSATFEPRRDDVFVASYPRSGTTWVQAICHALITGAAGFDFDHISEVAPWWERSLAYRDDAPRRFAGLAGPRVFKTHLHPRWLPRQGRAIYIERQPGDVAVSYHYLHRDYLGWDGELDAFVARFEAGELQYGRWADHLAAWNQPSMPCLRLRYEQLRRDPVPHIQAIAEHLELGVDRRRAEEVAETTSFAKMREQQRKFDHAGEIACQLGLRPGRFVRRGEIGAASDLVDPEQLRRLRVPATSRLPFWRLPAFLH